MLTTNSNLFSFYSTTLNRGETRMANNVRTTK